MSVDKKSSVKFCSSISNADTEHMEAPGEKLSCEILTQNDSVEPSYTRLRVPYYAICRQRYRKACLEWRLHQIPYEHEHLRGNQSNALGQVRLQRIFDYPVIKASDKRKIIKISPQEKIRLGKIMMD